MNPTAKCPKMGVWPRQYALGVESSFMLTYPAYPIHPTCVLLIAVQIAKAISRLVESPMAHGT